MEKQLVSPTSQQENLSVLIKFVEFTNTFRAIERCIWFRNISGKERNGEHTFQIALVAWFINDYLKLNLDTALVIQYAIVHDLVETYADDTSAFHDPSMSKEDWLHQKKTKKGREKTALRQIEREWKESFPEMAKTIRSYERQKDEEGRFVYAIDKLVSTINVFLDEGRTWKELGTTLQEMDAYKGPRAHKHADIGKLYDALFSLLEQNKRLFP